MYAKRFKCESEKGRRVLTHRMMDQLDKCNSDVERRLILRIKK